MTYLAQLETFFFLKWGGGGGRKGGGGVGEGKRGVAISPVFDRLTYKDRFFAWRNSKAEERYTYRRNNEIKKPLENSI